MQKTGHSGSAFTKELRRGNVMVSLTDDAYDYNDRLYTVEVTQMDGDEGLDNDAAVSGLEISATPEMIAVYLGAALAEAVRLAGSEVNVRRTASKADEAGMLAVRSYYRR